MRVIQNCFTAVLLAALFVPSTGCIFRKTKAAAPPVITAPPTARTIPPEIPDFPPPPKVETGQPTTTAPPIETPTPQPPPEPEKPKPAPRPRAPKPASPETVAPQDPSRVPQLTQILTPAEQEAHQKAIEAAIDNAEANLAKLAGQRLNASQQANVERAKSFIQQARQTRANDLATARSLAERADLLSQDLIRNLR